MAVKKVKVIAVHKVGVVVKGKVEFMKKGSEITLPEDEAQKLIASGAAKLPEPVAPPVKAASVVVDGAGDGGDGGNA